MNNDKLVIHLICWILILSFPFMFILDKSSGPDWMEYLRRIVPFVGYCIVFYLNYCFFIPKLLFHDKGRKFIAANFVTVIAFCIGIQLWMNCTVGNLRDNPRDRKEIIAPGPALTLDPLPMLPPHGPKVAPKGHPRISPMIVFSVRDGFIMVLFISLAVAIKLSGRLTKAENARREAEKSRAEAEKSRAEAELKNLRSQINPHFLLNTLNNIYALIEFDPQKAQTVVQELSKLLRYVLYEDQNTTVPLYKEINFIKNYIEIMRIRLSQKVKLTAEFNVPEDSQTQIAPLIFISLIENAFKHGVSASEESFINIVFTEAPDCITCSIKNSNFPKNSSDKSGSGIGLEQVGRRLELIYPGQYEWSYGPADGGKTYFSCLKIYIKQDIDTPVLEN